jgi:hypothetical protein
MDDLLCFWCLTEEDNAHVPAVTMRNGTAVCEKCALEWTDPTS